MSSAEGRVTSLHFVQELNQQGDSPASYSSTPVELFRMSPQGIFSPDGTLGHGAGLMEPLRVNGVSIRRTRQWIAASSKDRIETDTNNPVAGQEKINLWLEGLDFTQLRRGDRLVFPIHESIANSPEPGKGPAILSIEELLSLDVGSHKIWAIAGVVHQTGNIVPGNTVSVELSPKWEQLT